MMMMMMSMEQLMECLVGETKLLGEKTAPVPLHPPQISHDVIRDETQTIMVGSQPELWHNLKAVVTNFNIWGILKSHLER
jgi:hypothetical protein